MGAFASKEMTEVPSKEDKIWQRLEEKMKRIVPANGVKIAEQETGKNAATDEKTTAVEVGDTLCLNNGLTMKVEELIAQGTFATVYRIKAETANHCHALRLVHHPKTAHMEACIREVEILKHLGNLASGEEFLSLTCQFFTFGKWGAGSVGHICELLETPLADLLDIFREKDAFHPAAVRTIGYQVLSAFKFLHDHGVSHCDMKPDNIMFCNLEHEKLKVKVIDFGNSYFTPTLPQGSAMQNIFYRSPEALFGLPLNEKMDIWSFGCVLIEMFTGHDLFYVEEEPQLARALEALVGLPSNIDLCQHRQRLFKWDHGIKAFRVLTREETTKARINDKEDSSQVITDFSEIPYVAYNFIHGMGATDEDEKFVEVVSQMLTAKVESRLSAEEALRSLFFRDFNLNYNPLNERNESLADIFLQVLETGEPSSELESPVSNKVSSENSP